MEINSACRRRKSGSTLAGLGQQESGKGIWMQSPGTMGIQEALLTRLVRKDRMPGGCMTCWGMSGSGVRTCIKGIITIVLGIIYWGRLLVPFGSVGGAPVLAIPGTFALPFASTINCPAGSTTSVFDLQKQSSFSLLTSHVLMFLEDQ